jgi:predicted Zn-dependent protease
VAQKAECEFRAGRLRSALAAASRGQDPESRYWRTRAASELAREAFAQLDKLPDSRERREFRAELARSERRHQDAVAEVTAALKFAPGDPRLLADLATACFFARDYDRALATVKPLVEAHPGEPSLLALLGETLLQLQRLDEALPVLQKAARIDASNPAVQLALGRAYVQSGNFAAAIPLLEPQLASDEDGSLHMQLARAYQGAGQAGKAGPVLEKGRALQQAFQERSAASSEGKITPP